MDKIIDIKNRERVSLNIGETAEIVGIGKIKCTTHKIEDESSCLNCAFKTCGLCFLIDCTEIQRERISLDNPIDLENESIHFTKID